MLAPEGAVLDWEADFLKALRKLAIPGEAAAICGIDINVIFRWRRESERFEQEYQKAKEEGVELLLESEAFKRALEKSDLLLIASLNAYLPGRYKREGGKSTKFAGNGIVLEISDAQ